MDPVRAATCRTAVSAALFVFESALRTWRTHNPFLVVGVIQLVELVTKEGAHDKSYCDLRS